VLGGGGVALIGVAQTQQTSRRFLIGRRHVDRREWPLRYNFASMTSSRRPVLRRSPGLRGMSEGAMTSHKKPSRAVACRWDKAFRTAASRCPAEVRAPSATAPGEVGVRGEHPEAVIVKSGSQLRPKAAKGRQGARPFWRKGYHNCGAATQVTQTEAIAF
jgi:hypothetical protein